MSIVVLFSTISFTVDIHYCGDTLVDTAVFSKVDTCGIEMQNPITKDCSLTKKSCCKDQQIAIDGQDELKTSFDELTHEQQFFVASFAYSYLNIFNAINKKTTSFSEYPPPLLIKQIFKLDETYLI